MGIRSYHLSETRTFDDHGVKVVRSATVESVVRDDDECEEDPNLVLVDTMIALKNALHGDVDAAVKKLAAASDAE